MGYAPKFETIPLEAGHTAASIQDCIVFVQRTTIRPVVRQELKAAGVVAVHSADSIEACIELLGRLPRALLVVDWDHGLKTINRVLRAAQGAHKVDTRPIFLIAGQVSLDIVTTGTEYNVSRVHTGQISRGVIQEHIEHVFAEEADTGEFRVGLNQVAEARALHKWSEATSILQKFVARWPDNRRLTCELADSFIHEDRWDEAYTALEQLQSSKRQNLRIQHLKSRCLMKRGACDEAAELLKQSQLINPFNVDRLVDLGKALIQTGAIKEALSNFQAALALEPKHPEALEGRMQCRLVRADVNAALRLLREMSGVRELASVFNNAAILSVRLGHFDQALLLYRTAIGAVGQDTWLQARLAYNLGIAFHKWGRLPDALEWFERAVTADPTFADARQNVAALAAKRGRKVAVDTGMTRNLDESFAEVFEEEKVRRDGKE